MNCRHNKPAEMMAKFIDKKLRMGNKVCLFVCVPVFMDVFFLEACMFSTGLHCVCMFMYAGA